MESKTLSILYRRYDKIVFMFKSVFVSSYIDKQKTIASLLQESRDSGDFYFLLGLGTFITTLGLLIDSAIVILGGMLVAPLLFPILSLSMAVVTSSKLAVWRSLKIILRSIVLVFVISLLTSFLFGGGQEVGGSLLSQIIPDLFLFLISFAAGLAVSFSWARKDLSATLPGVAVSVSLIVPLAGLGVAISTLDRLLIAGSVTLFLMDSLAIVLAGIVIFALFGFSNLQKEEEDKITEEELEQQVHKEAIAEAENTSPIVDDVPTQA